MEDDRVVIGGGTIALETYIGRPATRTQNLNKRGWNNSLCGERGQILYSVGCSQNVHCEEIIIDHSIDVHVVNSSKLVISNCVNCIIYKTSRRAYSSLANIIIVKGEVFDLNSCVSPFSPTALRGILDKIRLKVETMSRGEWDEQEFTFPTFCLDHMLWAFIWTEIRNVFLKQYNHLFGKAIKAEKIDPADIPSGDYEI